MGDSSQYKKIKDPVYGYIEVDESIVYRVMDTATFQRLRNIRQTSYAPLYPSSLHNRFVHSLGVYHLGKMAYEAMESSIRDLIDQNSIFKYLEENEIVDKSRIKEVFLLACLLHDVGHSPFSHTGEDFYKTSFSSVRVISEKEEKRYEQRIKKTKNEEKKNKLQKEYDDKKQYSITKHLSYLTSDECFLKNVMQDVAPHEIMSCIVALEQFGEDNSFFRNNDERSFFARCITGVQYTEALNISDETWKRDDIDNNILRSRMFQNCVIRLLHSSVIDVDRMDYIIRDAKTMGYRSVSVDYERLVKGFALVKTGESEFSLGFHKNALSVIENAVYAHDIEKKWVQNHPVIIYDSYLLKKSIDYINDQINAEFKESKSSLFSFDSLTDKGSVFTGNNGFKIRFLSDSDLIFLMKNRYDTDASEEYLYRCRRGIPAWKSEAEYRNLFSDKEQELIRRIIKLLPRNVDSVYEINDDTLAKILEDKSKISGDDSEEIRSYDRQEQYVRALLDLCDCYKIERNLIFLSKSFFKSNFSKKELEKIPIFFPQTKSISELKMVVPTLFSANDPDSSFVYLYYHSKSGREKIDVKSFSKNLIRKLEEIE